MKTKLILLAAMAAMLSVGFASCSKDDDNSGSSNNGNSGNGGGDNTEWVDLGLPSGLLWAKCNVGASSPEDYGNYYAWGETTTKSDYSWETYAYGNSSTTLTKYCSKTDNGFNGFTDALTTLQSSDDAVTAVFGNGARIPTKDEWDELLNNCTEEWVSQNGVNGCKFTASNGNTLFLPAAGYCDGSELRGVSRYGDYWSSSLYTDEPNCAWDFYIGSYGTIMGNDSRYYGLSVRAVRPAI